MCSSTRNKMLRMDGGVSIISLMTTAAVNGTNTSGWRPVDSLENRLRLIRAEKKLSQRAAAELIGITQREWQIMEDGRAARRIDQKVAKIAATLGVDRDWLMWGGALDGAEVNPKYVPRIDRILGKNRSSKQPYHRAINHGNNRG